MRLILYLVGQNTSSRSKLRNLWPCVAIFCKILRRKSLTSLPHLRPSMWLSFNLTFQKYSSSRYCHWVYFPHQITYCIFSVICGPLTSLAKRSRKEIQSTTTFLFSILQSFLAYQFMIWFKWPTTSENFDCFTPGAIFHYEFRSHICINTYFDHSSSALDSPPHPYPKNYKFPMNHVFFSASLFRLQYCHIFSNRNFVYYY